MSSAKRRRSDGDGEYSPSTTKHRGYVNKDEESQALCSILQGKGGSVDVTGSDTSSRISSFFDNTWQIEPRLYRRRKDQKNQENIKGQGECTLTRAVDMGWDGLASLLERSRSRFAVNNSSSIAGAAAAAAGTTDPPLFFRSQTPLQPPEVEATYNCNPFAAYLDGCSVVFNHADLLCPRLAALCLDLQKSFPHVYINSYLTPPGAQAVPAHTDDRDVFVIQLLGEKVWKVYDTVPIAHPYPQEQVGKGSMEVPDSVMQGPTAIDTTVRQGDVLYMPRGYVHEARTESDQPSFHATVAIATHDWSLAGNISELVSRTLTSVPEFRLAIDRNIGRADSASDAAPANESESLSSLQSQIDSAFDIVRQKVTPEQIASQLQTKYDMQNKMSRSARMELIHEEADKEKAREKESRNGANVIVGPGASSKVFVGTIVRASTDEERACVRPPQPRSPHSGPSDRGLTVREKTCQPLMTIIQKLKQDKSIKVKVSGLRSLMLEEADADSIKMVCDLSLLSFVRCCVELGAMAVVS